ncbi:MAG: hypothetical protein ACO1N6_09350 [Microcella sp.]
MSEPAESLEYAANREEYVRALRKLRETDELEYTEYSGSPQYARDLLDVGRRYVDRERFSVGDLVQWKPGMKNQRFPHDGKPAIVLGWPEVPQTEEADGEKLVEPLDIILGFLDGNGSLRVYTFTSARLTAWHGSESLSAPSTAAGDLI